MTNDNIVLSLANLPASGAEFEPEVRAIQAQAIARLDRIVAEYISAAIADNTRRAYRQDLSDFCQWGGCIPCSPEVLSAYIADRASTLSPYTIKRRVVGICRAHVSQGLSDPSKCDLVRTVLRGIQRKNRTPQRQVSPLLKQDLLTTLPMMTGTKGIRDRALLLLGFAAALRRSELVALNVSDLEFVREGILVKLRRSKTDQEGEGRVIAVPLGRSKACPVKAVEEWLKHAQIVDGAIFRPIGKGGKIGAARLSAQSVALTVKLYAEKAGLLASNFSGHSLRSGLATSAAQAGVALHNIQTQTGHRSIEMVTRYVRNANLFEDNASGAVL